MSRLRRSGAVFAAVLLLAQSARAASLDAQSPSEVAAMVQRMKNMQVDTEHLRVLSKSMKPKRAHVDEHVKRQLMIADAMDKLAHKLSVRGALADLGVVIRKSPAPDSIVTTITVQGKERLRLTDSVRANANNDEGGPAVHRDEYDDLEYYGASQRDDALAVLAAADAEAEAAEIEYNSINWGEELEDCEVASGPSATERAECVDEAFGALLGVIGSRAQGRESMNNIRAAWDTFKTVLDARPAIAVVTVAIDALVASITLEVVVSAVVVGATLYFGYKLYECLDRMAAGKLVVVFDRPAVVRG